MDQIKKEHDRDIAHLQRLVREQKEPICLAKSALHSNTTRSSSYKKSGFKLPVDSLNRILSIDTQNKSCIAEPRVSMKELAAATIKKGLVPKVVPEFKGITVGGAVMGCGGESSSHRVGLFHNTARSFDILLGSGEVVRATSSEHRDLFYGVVGSYGSLGCLVRCEIELEEAKPFVAVQMHKYSSGKEAIKKIDALMHQDVPPEFLEGVIFSKDLAVVLEGNKSDTQKGYLLKEGITAPWYYQFIKEKEVAFSMPLEEYLFRYDRGAFWMGSYVFSLPILKKLFCEGIFKLQTPKPFTERERLAFAKLKDPGAILRALSFPVAASQPLYSLLHKCEDWVEDRFIVQDFTLPRATCPAFLDAVEEVCPIYPLWLCPVRAEDGPSLFAPHNLGTSSINIGVYGIPRTIHPLKECLKNLETRLHELSGRKWLYTNSQYTPEEFWSIYSKDEYQALRKKYHAENVWLSIESKVLKS